MKPIYVTAIILTVLLLTGCDGPENKVIEKDKMIVYNIREIGTEHFKYEYWITDYSGKGWAFYTNQKFGIGDEIVVTNKQSNK